MTAKAIDRAHAKRTKTALQAFKVWTINRARGDLACAERLDTITNELQGYIWQIDFQKPYWVICWWTWHDDEG